MYAAGRNRSAGLDHAGGDLQTLDVGVADLGHACGVVTLEVVANPVQETTSCSKPLGRSPASKRLAPARQQLQQPAGICTFSWGPSALIGFPVPHRRSWSARTIAEGDEIHCRHLGGAMTSVNFPVFLVG
jgi:hypothetical protein